jgi:hypothetical protein
MRTLCHEFCHHLDFKKFGFVDSWPTRGFLSVEVGGLIGNGRIGRRERGRRDALAATHPSVALRSCRNNDRVHV